MRLPARPGDRGARQGRQLGRDRRGDRIGERRVVGDQDRLRRLVVLGLRQQVDRDRGADRCRRRPGPRPRTGRRCSRCRRGRTPGAWPRRHRRCRGRRCGPPARWSRCRRPAPRSPARRRRGRSPTRPARRAAASTSGFSTPSGARHAHGDARHAGDPRRDRVHQHRGRIGRLAARHVEPDRIERRPAHAERQAGRVRHPQVGRQLRAMERLDAARRRGPARPPARRECRRPPRRSPRRVTRSRSGRQRQPVEPRGVVAAAPHRRARARRR